jgi:iron(III) transport system ATP-binding protein
MAEVRLEGVSKRFGQFEALADFSEAVRDGEFVSLLGPSGCGKTTTLRIVAGFERATAGRVLIGDRLVSCSRSGTYVPPENRNIGMVFQSYAVWPHMNVFANVGYPLKVRGTARRELREKVERVLDLVHLSGLEERLPNQLSGGQQQRVALARALVAEPALLLLDEPLSNLDAKLRESMRFEIKDVQRRLGVTVVYVTHDQAEAMVMSDRIVVMNQGRIQQVDVPRVIYDSPANQFVADFIGLINFLEATVVSRAGDEGEVQVTGVPGAAPFRSRIPSGLAAGDRLLLAVRPEAVGLSAEPGDGAMPGRVTRRIYLGNETEYRVALGDVEVRATADAADDRPEGCPVWVSLRRFIPMRL